MIASTSSSCVSVAQIVAEAKSGFASGKRDEAGVVQVRMNNVTTNGTFDWSSVCRVPLGKHLIHKYRLSRGDILFNATNSPKLVGKAAVFEDYPEAVVFSNHFIRLQINQSRADSRYVCRWLNDQWRRRTFEQLSTQWVNQAAVKKGDLLALQIPLPSLQEQHRIVAILDKAATARRAHAEAAEQTNQLVQAIFFEMFGDPATNPKQWPQSRLMDLGASVRYGLGQPPRVSSIGLPLLRATNIRRGIISPVGLIYVAAEDVPRSRNAFLHADDVLVVRSGAYTGDVAHVGAKWAGAVAGYDLIVSPGPNLTGEFLACFLLSSHVQRGHFGSLRQRSAQPHLNAQQVSETPLFSPPPALQRVFSERVKQVLGLREAQENSGVLLDQLFDGLLAKVFTGNLVPDGGKKPSLPSPSKSGIPRFPRRQQVVLALLNEHLGRGRSGVTQTQMMKHTFLTQKRGGRKAGVNRLYQFHPYHYGPFDKKVYADLEILSKKDLIQTEKRSKITKPGDEFILIRLTPEGAQIANNVASQLDPKLRETIKSVVTEFGHLTHDQLLKRVYQLYPRYASKSVKRALLGR